MKSMQAYNNDCKPIQYRNYEQTQTFLAIVVGSTDAFRKAVETSLKRDALFNTNFTVVFRSDVFQYLFKDKRV